jgi:electron transfer flavoprotein alpha subunit
VTVLVLTELDGAEPADASLRALTLARGLGDASAVVFGAAAPPVGGVTDVYLIDPALTGGYAPVAWARTLAGTDRGNEVLAHLAALTGLPMAANCVAVTAAADGVHELVRHRWAGLLLEDAVLEAPLALFTVATDAIAPQPAEAGPATVHGHKPELTEADVAVRAVESAAGFAPLEELAGLLGGVVGVSRVVTSEGWRPHRQQVGQTGTRITPELYLACGISGAIQHIAGCAGAKHIIAVNTDPGAPILSHADYAVIGDLHRIVPELVAALRARDRR